MRFFCSHCQMGKDSVDELPPDGQDRVETGQRVLEDESDVPSPYATHSARRKGVDAFSREGNLPGFAAKRRCQKINDSGSCERLSGPRFSDETKDLTWRDRKAGSIECGENPAAPRQYDRQISYVE